MCNERALFGSRRAAASPLALSLDILSSIQGAGLRIVPAEPSPAMLQAAIRAGAPSKAAAAKIWGAMLESNC